MTRRIEIMPDALANQIAAGEVVERPASVVKELVENALDAAATRVHVAIQNGGKSEVRVADDGCGMSRDDALLCLDRHATSKIRSFEDLRRLRTFGFRGEALPSIASVSRLTLETAEAGGVGTRVRMTGGRIHAAEECARQAGTTVVVRNLFFNVPARAKFLRSAAQETRAVAEAMVSLALAHLSCAFRLESNGRVLLDLPQVSDLIARVAALWGDDAARRLVPLAHTRENVAVAGVVERPDAALTGPRRTHLFVGGRPFRDRELVLAAERGYRTTVPYGARPSLLLYIDVSGADVDINVHPTKAEVRFRARPEVEAAVEEAVRRALATVESAATLDKRPALPQLQTPAPPAGESTPDVSQLAFFVMSREPGVRDRGEETQREQTAHEVLEGAPPARLWQLHDSYILAETRTGVLIIDQHSAHERILFEQLMRGFANGGQSSQRLLFPLTLRLSPAEFGVIEGSAEVLRRAGFEIEPFGGRTVIVHGAPAPHPYFNAERCLREMVSDLATGSELTRAARNQHERIAMTFACKGAIKAGQKLSEREMFDLFQRLFLTELPYHDVHGRATVVRLSLHELERRFGRHG